MKPTSSRRRFLKNSAQIAAGTLALSAISSPLFAIRKGLFSPADRIRVGAIGINGMGWSNTRAILQHAGVQLIALCDIDQQVLAKRQGELKQLNVDEQQVTLFDDYRKLLEVKNLDAVIIGTPDHWHCLQMVHACEAGKDVYVEKPIANNLSECAIMVAAQKRYNRIVQVGQWQRSVTHFKEALDFLHSGVLGNIRTVKVWAYQGWLKPKPVMADSPVPAGIDYEKWLGPAPKKPFNESRFHFHWRWFWDYAGGLMTDWGVHLLDYALLGMKASEPKTVTSVGGKYAFPDYSHETPDSQVAIFEFDNFILQWEHALGIDNGPYSRDHGIAFIGNHGTMVLDRNGWEVVEERGSAHKVSKELQKNTENGVVRHTGNFVEVIRSRNLNDLRCPIADGAHVAKISTLGNIAFRSGRKLHWDRSAGQFFEKDINKKYLKANYHNGYRLPDI